MFAVSFDVVFCIFLNMFAVFAGEPSMYEHRFCIETWKFVLMF